MTATPRNKQSKSVAILKLIAVHDGMRFGEIQDALWAMTYGTARPKHVRGYWCTNLLGGPFYHAGLLHTFCTKGADGKWRIDPKKPAPGPHPWTQVKQHASPVEVYPSLAGLPDQQHTAGPLDNKITHTAYIYRKAQELEVRYRGNTYLTVPYTSYTNAFEGHMRVTTRILRCLNDIGARAVEDGGYYGDVAPRTIERYALDAVLDISQRFPG
jgi:hypothetical protein